MSVFFLFGPGAAIKKTIVQKGIKHVLNMYQNSSKCVNLDKIISKYDTIIDFGVKIDIFRFCFFLWNVHVTFISKTTSLRHVSDKVLRAKWPHGTCGNIMFLSKSEV